MAIEKNGPEQPVQRLSNVFPIVAKFGGDYPGGRGRIEYRTIVGLREHETNPNHSHILFADHGPNDSYWYLKIEDLFQICARAHLNGEIADLTTATLRLKKIIQPK